MQSDLLPLHILSGILNSPSFQSDHHTHNCLNLSFSLKGTRRAFYPDRSRLLSLIKSCLFTDSAFNISPQRLSLTVFCKTVKHVSNIAAAYKTFNGTPFYITVCTWLSKALILFIDRFYIEKTYLTVYLFHSVKRSRCASSREAPLLSIYFKISSKHAFHPASNLPLSQCSG